VEQNLKEILKKRGPEALEDVAVIAAALSHLSRKSAIKHFKNSGRPGNLWARSFRPGQ
jgi:hypothetical protein